MVDVPSCHESQEASDYLPTPSGPSITINNGKRSGPNRFCTSASKASDFGNGDFSIEPLQHWLVYHENKTSEDAPKRERD
jgi:hypothetical protein